MLNMISWEAYMVYTGNIANLRGVQHYRDRELFIRLHICLP